MTGRRCGRLLDPAIVFRAAVLKSGVGTTNLQGNRTNLVETCCSLAKRISDRCCRAPRVGGVEIYAAMLHDRRQSSAATGTLEVDMPPVYAPCSHKAMLRTSKYKLNIQMLRMFPRENISMFQHHDTDGTWYLLQTTGQSCQLHLTNPPLSLAGCASECQILTKPTNIQIGA